MKLRSLAVVVALSFAFASSAIAAPIFYVSTSNSASAVPGNAAITGAAGSSGTLNIWANSDIRLSGVSLDVLSSNTAALKFTSPLVVNGQGTAWAFLDGPQSVTDAAAQHIGGGAVPGSSGNGIGAGSPTGNDFLLGSVGYVLGAGGTSDLSLRIASNEVVDWDGNYPTLHFGSGQGQSFTGDFAANKSAVVGAAVVGGVIPEPATMSLIGLAFVGGLGLARRRS